MNPEKVNNEKQEKVAEPGEQKEVTSGDIKNAHASGDGALNRSEEAITDKDLKKENAKPDTENY